MPVVIIISVEVVIISEESSGDVMNQTVQMVAFPTPTEILNSRISGSDNEVLNEMPIDVTAEMLPNDMQPANNVVPDDYHFIQGESGKQMQHNNNDDRGREAHTVSFVGSNGHERESHSSSSADKANHLEPSVKTGLFENTTGEGNININRELSDTFDPYSELYKTDNDVNEFSTRTEFKYPVNETLGKILSQHFDV